MSRVTEIRYIGYGVTDIEAERRYYGEVFGLDPVPSDDGLAWFKAPGHGEHHVVRLRPADENRVDVIALAADSRADVDALCGKVAATGAKIVHEPRDLTTPGGGYGFRFFSPDGLQFEISSDVETGPRRELTRWEGLPVKISHIVLHSPDHPALVKCFTYVLGFKISDELDFAKVPGMPEQVKALGDARGFFMRHGTDHHAFVLFNKGVMDLRPDRKFRPEVTINQITWQVGSLKEVVDAFHYLQERDVPIQRVGRDMPGSNWHCYVYDPDGHTNEFYYGIEQVGFWTGASGDSNQTLYYFLKWESLADREKKWTAFQADPEWISARAETEKNGAIVARVENQILQPTGFSSVK